MTYFTSKAALNAITMILARDHPGFLINCCCPGWVGTELGNQAGHAPKTVGELLLSLSMDGKGVVLSIFGTWPC